MQHKLSLNPFSRPQRVLACATLVSVTYATFPVTLVGLGINMASGAGAALIMWTFPGRHIPVSSMLAPSLFRRNSQSLTAFMNSGGASYRDEDGVIGLVSGYQSAAQYSVATRLVDPLATYIALFVLLHLLGHALLTAKDEPIEKEPIIEWPV